MRLGELMETQKTGTYAGVRFDNKTKDMLGAFCETHDVSNFVGEEKLHTTLLYSRKHLPNFTPKGKIDPPFECEASHAELWKTRATDKTALVLCYKCPELDKRHEELMKTHDAMYDFDEYKTHVTLSYDVKLDEGDLEVLNQEIEQLPALVIVEEYGEDLDLNWAENNK